MNYALIVAQVSDLSVYAQYGLAGIIFGSMMLFLLPRLRSIERSLDWLAMAQLLQTVAVAEANEVSKARARELLAVIEAKNKKGK